MNSHNKFGPAQTERPAIDGEYIAMMPLRRNVPHPSAADWQLTTCPQCGRDCWYQQNNAKAVNRLYKNLRFLCTECALRAHRKETP